MSSASNDGFGEAAADLDDTDTERKRVLDGRPTRFGTKLPLIFAMAELPEVRLDFPKVRAFVSQQENGCAKAVACSLSSEIFHFLASSEQSCSCF